MQAGDFVSSVEVVVQVRLAGGGAHLVELWLGVEGGVHHQEEALRRGTHPVLQLLVVEVAQTRRPHKGVVGEGNARHPTGKKHSRGDQLPAVTQNKADSQTQQQMKL